MFAVVGKVHGQGIIYTQPEPQPYYSLFYPGTLDFGLDIDGDGTNDFILRSNDPQTSVNNAALIPLGNNLIVAMNSYVGDLTNGQSIGSSLDPGYAWNNSKTPIGTLAVLLDPQISEGGNFAGKTSGYIGFDLIANGNNYYGWIYVSAPDLGGGFTGDAGTYANIVSWAYETSPNTSIRAGQTSEDVSFTANIIGANEVPPVHSRHSGTGTFTLESFVNGYVLNYHVELDGSFVPSGAGIFGPASPTSLSAHEIADLGIAQIVFPPPPPPNQPLIFGTPNLNRPVPILPPPSMVVYDGRTNLSTNQVAALLQGQFYVNLKSARFPRGELRGQIFSDQPLKFSATLSRRPEIPRSRPHVGEAAFTLVGANLTGNVALNTNFSWNAMGIYVAPLALPQTLVAGLTNFIGVQIPPGGFPGHPELPGLPGQVLYPEQTILTDEQVYQLKRGEFYLNVLLTSRFPRGEISGQILPAE